MKKIITLSAILALFTYGSLNLIVHYKGDQISNAVKMNHNVLQGQKQTVPLTSSGAYLASRASQHRNTWDDAATFLERALFIAEAEQKQLLNKSAMLAEKEDAAKKQADEEQKAENGAKGEKKRAPAILTVPTTEASTPAELKEKHRSSKESLKKSQAELSHTISELKQRILIFQLGAGHFDKAYALAKDMSATQRSMIKTPHTNHDRLGFAQSVLIVGEFKKNDMEQVRKNLDVFSSGAISDSLQPLFSILYDAEMAKKAQKKLGIKDTDKYVRQGLSPLHQAYALEYSGNMKGARILYKKVADRAGLGPFSVALAMFHLRNGDRDEGIALLTKLAEEFPEDKEIFDVVQDLKDGDVSPQNPTYLAMAAHTKSLQHALAVSLYELALGHLSGRSVETALLLTQFSYALATDIDRITFFLAEILQSRGSYNEALTLLKTIPQNSNSYIDAVNRQADIYADMENYEAAFELLEEALEHHDDAEMAHYLGGLYRTQERYEEALTAYQKTEDILGDDMPERFWSIYYYRGIILSELDRWDEAEAALLKAKNLKPDNPFVLNYLGYSWADQGKNVDEALGMLKKALELSPESGFITDSVGWAYYKLTNYEEALKYLERAAEMMPYDPEVNDHLGDVYWQVGRKLEAYYQWKRAIDYAKEDDKAHQKIAEKAKEKIKSGL